MVVEGGGGVGREVRGQRGEWGRRGNGEGGEVGTEEGGLKGESGWRGLRGRGSKKEARKKELGTRKRVKGRNGEEGMGRIGEGEKGRRRRRSKGEEIREGGERDGQREKGKRRREKRI